MSEDFVTAWRLTCDIRFFVKGKMFAGRSWRTVPRVGDEIMLGPTDPKKPYRVVRVVWGVEGPEEEQLHRQAVNIELKPIRGRHP